MKVWASWGGLAEACPGGQPRRAGAPRATAARRIAWRLAREGAAGAAGTCALMIACPSGHGPSARPDPVFQHPVRQLDLGPQPDPPDPLDRGLLMRSEVTHGYLVRATESQRQLSEVLARFDLAGSVEPFRLCLRCNVELVTVAKQQVTGRVPPGVWQKQSQFVECPNCGRVYWKGSHHARMKRLLGEATTPDSSTS